MQQVHQIDQIDLYLAALLRGEKSDVTEDALASSRDILERIDLHGIAGLLNARNLSDGAFSESTKTELRDRVVSRLFWEENHDRLLRRVSVALEALKIVSILIKGTALAHTHYDDPVERVRGDTDMLVCPETFKIVGQTLVKIGYQEVPSDGAEIYSSARSYTFEDTNGTIHNVDLHMRLNNSSVLAELFSFDELLSRSVNIPRLGAAFRSPCAPDAMLIACFHRLVHRSAPYFIGDVAYRLPDRLIWLYDIHLLANGFSLDDWRIVLQQSKEKELAATTSNGLRAAQHALGTRIPDDLLDNLDAISRRERPARYLAAGPVRAIAMNLAAERGLRRKGQFLRELAFPSAEHMRRKSNDNKSYLPWLYLKRAWRGIRKLRNDKSSIK